MDNQINTEQQVASEQEATNEQNQMTEPKKKQKKKKKRSVLSIIFNILGIIVILILVAELIIGFLNMQKLSNGEEPIWCLDDKTEEQENKTTRTCNLGLYRIVKTDTDRETKITLQPFFLSE